MLNLARNTLKRVPSFQEILQSATGFTMSKEEMSVLLAAAPLHCH